jgi:methionyl-tRNA formyltransferase
MRIAIWGDAVGLPQSLAAMRDRTVAAIVGADNRPGDWTDLARLAAAQGVPFLRQPFKKHAARRTEFAAAVAGVRADLFVVNSYSMILDADWLTIPRFGVINVHGGLLPSYRGANVLNWVLVNGEAETGVTVHWMDKGIDTGDVLLQERLAIAEEDTALTLRGKLSEPVPRLLRESIAKIAEGSPPRIPQNSEQARHWPRRRPGDGRFEWSWPADRIYNLVRALVAPWPGAFFKASGCEAFVLDHWVSHAQIASWQQQWLRALADLPRIRPFFEGWKASLPSVGAAAA